MTGTHPRWTDIEFWEAIRAAVKRSESSRTSYHPELVAYRRKHGIPT